MKRTIRFLMPIFLAISIVMVGQYLKPPCNCGSSHDAALLGSMFGCSDAKQAGTMPATIKTDERSKESKNAAQAEHRVTFVEIGSVNCIPCKMMQPIMKAVEEEFRGQVRVVFHDVWTQQGKADAMKYKIRVIPTQVFLDAAGKEYFRHEGFFPKEELVKVLKMKGVQ